MNPHFFLRADPQTGMEASSDHERPNNQMVLERALKPACFGARLFVVALLFLGSSLSAGVAQSSEADAKSPNVVLFLVDDMGLMDTSVPFLTDEKGVPKKHPLNEFYRTPHMEKLAAEGIRFNQYYAMSVCSPTRISILTGQNSARHRTTTYILPEKNNRSRRGPRQWNWRGLDKKSVTLPRLLQEIGYRTIHVGKGHFGPFDSEGADPANLGFEINIGGYAGGRPGSYCGMLGYGAKAKKKRYVPHLEKYHGTETFLTEALTREAKSQLTAAVKAEKPFFLYFPHYAVHAPFDSDPRFAANYKQSGKSAAAQGFATLVEGMDKSLGDLVQHLDQLGVSEETVIFFLGDNGSDAPLGPKHAVASSAPLRGKKGTHYEGGMRVPYIAAWAKPNPQSALQKRLPIAAGSVCDQVASVCDLFPTICELAEVVPPKDHTYDGYSLQRRLAGKRDERAPAEFLMHFPHEHNSDYFTCYRRGDWKVVYHYFPSKESEEGHYQLFHLAVDPFESRNLAADEPEQLGTMMRGLIESLKKHQALYPEDAADQPEAHRPRLP